MSVISVAAGGNGPWSSGWRPGPSPRPHPARACL